MRHTQNIFDSIVVLLIFSSIKMFCLTVTGILHAAYIITVLKY